MYLQSAFHSTHYFMENHDVDVYTFFLIYMIYSYI